MNTRPMFTDPSALGHRLPRSLQRAFHPQLTPTEQVQLNELRTRMDAEEAPVTDEWMVVDDSTGKPVAGPFDTREEADRYSPWEDLMVVRADQVDRA